MTDLAVDIRSEALTGSDTLAALVRDRVASALSAQDPTLWGPDAEPEAAKRLAWVSLPRTSRPLVDTIAELRRSLHADGIDRVVLAGMGGSSLAPEVICATAGVALTVLDTTDAGQVADALAGDLERTVLVVSSKSGSTVETDSHRRIFVEAFTAAGLDATRHVVVVTDPGSPLQASAEQAGYRAVIAADPNVGGRYSALTAFGLVPAGLAGADIGALLDSADSVSATLAADDDTNPALRLGAALATAHAHQAEKVVLADTGSGIVGFADWAEQLIAESTGKQGVGLLPVAVENAAAPGFVDAGTDATTVAIGPAPGDAAIAVTGELGALFQLWEHAVAVAGRIIGINPFDQPDVEAAKKAARSMLDGGSPDVEPVLVEGAVQVFQNGVGGPWDTLADALRGWVDAAPEHGYLAVQAYLDRLDDASVAVLRTELARRTGLQTTFGWGPRFLHSTGQYHKGGHPNGAFLQITGAVEDDIEVPDAGYSLGTLQHAQALGDGTVLADHGRPVLRLHLTDRAAGLVEVMRAVQALGSDPAPSSDRV